MYDKQSHFVIKCTYTLCRDQNVTRETLTLSRIYIFSMADRPRQWFLHNNTNNSTLSWIVNNIWSKIIGDAMFYNDEYMQMQENRRDLSNDHCKFKLSDCATLSFAVYSRMHTCRHCAYLCFVYECARKIIYSHRRHIIRKTPTLSKMRQCHRTRC